MRTFIDDEPDDALASKLIPVANLMRSGAWSDGRLFRRKHLYAFAERVADELGHSDFKVEAYAMSSAALVPTIILVARPLDAVPLE